MTSNQKQYLSIIAALVILAGAYAFGKVYLKNSSPLPNPPSPRSEDGAGPQGEGNKSAASAVEGWKIYRNEEFGFEFQYPKNWDYTLDEDTACFKEQGKEYIVEETSVCGILVFAGKINPNRLEIDELISRRKQSNPNLIVTRFRIDLKADAVRIQKYGDETYFDYDGNAFAVSGESAAGAEVASVLDQILSTFKFLK